MKWRDQVTSDGVTKNLSFTQEHGRTKDVSGRTDIASLLSDRSDTMARKLLRHVQLNQAYTGKPILKNSRILVPSLDDITIIDLKYAS